MFPEVEKLLSRKKDHGRAEALLIATYGHMARNARGDDDTADPLCRRVRQMIIDAEAAEAAAAEEAEAAWVEVEVVRMAAAARAAAMAAGAGAGAAARAGAEAAAGARGRVAEAKIGEEGEGAKTTESKENRGTRGGLRPRVGANDPLPYFGPYFGMTCKELGREAKSRGLRVSGRKMELILRLEQDDVVQRRQRAEEAEAASAEEAEAEEEGAEQGAAPHSSALQSGGGGGVK